MKLSCHPLKIFFLFTLSLLFLPPVWAKIQAPPPQALLAPLEDIHSDPYYEWVVRQQDRGLAFESAKIEYLIERLRNSPYTFVRNKVEYPSAKAAKHLSWKYGFAKNRVKTANDFITHLATKSINTGLFYLAKLPNGLTYRVGDLLENELKVLEANLSAETLKV